MEEKKRELTFLSYANDDLEKVWKVYEGLKEREVSVWFDKADLGPGKWKPQIEKKIPKCRYFIFCLSEASIKKTEEGTGFVEEELQTAWKIADAQDEKKFTIVPVRFEDCGHGDHRLSTFQQYDLFPDMGKGLDKLAVNIGGISLTDAEAHDERTENEKLIDSLLGKAAIAYYSVEYNKALSMYETVINIDPKNTEAWIVKGIALHALGKYDEAIYAYDRATAIKPDFHYSCYYKGIALDYLGKYEDAIAAYDKAIEIKPDDHEAWSNKGLAFYHLGKYVEAISAYNKAIEIKPDSHEAWSNKGLALYHSGKYEDAIKAYDNAIEIMPDYHEAWFNKGLALELFGRNKEAKQAFKKAAELENNSQAKKK